MRRRVSLDSADSNYLFTRPSMVLGSIVDGNQLCWPLLVLITGCSFPGLQME